MILLLLSICIMLGAILLFLKIVQYKKEHYMDDLFEDDDLGGFENFTKEVKLEKKVKEMEEELDLLKRRDEAKGEIIKRLMNDVKKMKANK